MIDFCYTPLPSVPSVAATLLSSPIQTVPQVCRICPADMPVNLADISTVDPPIGPSFWASAHFEPALISVKLTKKFTGMND